MYQATAHAAGLSQSSAGAPTERVPSKINEIYWELIDFIFPLMKDGQKAKEIARLANRVGLRNRKGKRLNAAYIDSQINYYKMRDHETVEGVYRAHDERRRAKQMAREVARAPGVSIKTYSEAEPRKHWTSDELIRMVLESDLRMEQKMERIEEISAGRITAPISVTSRIDEPGSGVFRLVVEMVNITDPAKARVFALDSIDAYMLSHIPKAISDFAAMREVK